MKRRESEIDEGGSQETVCKGLVKPPGDFLTRAAAVQVQRITQLRPPQAHKITLQFPLAADTSPDTARTQQQGCTGTHTHMDDLQSQNKRPEQDRRLSMFHQRNAGGQQSQNGTLSARTVAHFSLEIWDTQAAWSLGFTHIYILLQGF